MLIVCPGCKTRFSFDDNKIGSEGIKLRCNKCRAIFKVVRRAAQAQVPAPPPVSQDRQKRITVVIANESKAFCAAVVKVLAPEPFQIHCYNDGKEAWDAIRELKPEVVLLDVALPSMYGFEVCESVRKAPELSSTKLILIASIYDKTRYKRSPHSLYGADDYIEKHHIPDSLAAMIYRHVSGQHAVESPPAKSPEDEANALPEELSSKEKIEQEAVRQELKRDEERETSSEVISPPKLSDAQVKAKRLARIIVSDIILYNQAKVEEGVRNGKFFELLADDISEGRALYTRRVAEEIRNVTSYLDDAFNELIAKKKQELNL